MDQSTAAQRSTPGPGTKPGPGRPRTAGLDERILAAAIRILDSGEDVSVSKLVAESGVSRAAIYRRWPSIAQLTAAALDVGRTAYPPVRVDEGLRESLIASLLPRPRGRARGTGNDLGYLEQRFKQRLKLIMSDPELQRTYWESHIARRRAPLERSLTEARSKGMLRPDLDVSACVDALAGVVYYQFIIRGEDLHAETTRARLIAAFDVIWRGMAVEGAHAAPEKGV